jgi:hypothetical protein
MPLKRENSSHKETGETDEVFLFFRPEKKNRLIGLTGLTKLCPFGSESGEPNRTDPSWPNTDRLERR